MDKALQTANYELETNLISLEDIIQKKVVEDDGISNFESYIRKSDSTSYDVDGLPLDCGQTIIVHRIDINYNDVECQLLTFTDLSIYQRLKQQEQRNQLLKTLNTSVHHEMLCPLGANITVSETLMRKIDDPALKDMAKTINIASKLVVLHANDLLDQSII